MRHPELPPVCVAVGNANIGCGLECVAPAGKPAVGECTVALGVALAHQAEGIFVETHPEMQSMLFHAVCYAAPRCSFATQSPAHLIHGDLITPMVLGPGELEGS